MEREEEQKVQNTDQNLPTNAGGVEDAGSNLGSGKSLEEEIATRSSLLAWRIPWTKESGGLQSIGSHRVRDNWACMTHASAVVEWVDVMWQWHVGCSLTTRQTTLPARRSFHGALLLGIPALSLDGSHTWIDFKSSLSFFLSLSKHLPLLCWEGHGQHG